MSFDAHANLAYSTLAIAPAPAISGGTLTVQAGNGALFPAPPFNCTVWPPSVTPLETNAEIVRVTAIVGDAFAITRAQEATTAKALLVGYQIANTITKKVITDIEAASSGGAPVIFGVLADPNGIVVPAFAGQFYKNTNPADLSLWCNADGTINGWT